MGGSWGEGEGGKKGGKTEKRGKRAWAEGAGWGGAAAWQRPPPPAPPSSRSGAGRDWVGRWGGGGGGAGRAGAAAAGLGRRRGGAAGAGTTDRGVGGPPGGRGREGGGGRGAQRGGGGGGERAPRRGLPGDPQRDKTSPVQKMHMIYRPERGPCPYDEIHDVSKHTFTGLKSRRGLACSSPARNGWGACAPPRWPPGPWEIERAK